MERVFYFVTSKQSQQWCTKQNVIRERSLERHRGGLSGTYSFSLSFASFRRLWFSRTGDEIEIVTYSRVSFIRTSTGRHRRAQLHRRPIVPRSRFVTVIYWRYISRSAEASSGKSTLLFSVLFPGMSRAFSNCASSRRDRRGKVLPLPVGTTRVHVHVYVRYVSPPIKFVNDPCEIS